MTDPDDPGRPGPHRGPDGVDRFHTGPQQPDPRYRTDLGPVHPGPHDGPSGGPPQKKTGTIVAAVTAAVVVLAGAGVGIAAAAGAFSGGSETGAPAADAAQTRSTFSEAGTPEHQVETATRTFITAFGAGDVARFRPLMCAEDLERSERAVADFGGTAEEFYAVEGEIPVVTMDVTDVTISPDGDSATVTMDGKIEWSDGEVELCPDETEYLVKEDGAWKVC